MSFLQNPRYYICGCIDTYEEEFAGHGDWYYTTTTWCEIHSNMKKERNKQEKELNNLISKLEYDLREARKSREELDKSVLPGRVRDYQREWANETDELKKSAKILMNRLQTHIENGPNGYEDKMKRWS
jgi:hypothetical protein